MKTAPKVYVSIVCSIVIAACSDSEDPAPAESTSGIVGTWSSSCREDSGTFVISHLELGNESVVFREENFGDNVCMAKLFELGFSGSLRIGDSIELSDSTVAVQADYRYNSIAVTINAQETIDEYNSQGSCDRTDWQASVSYDITDCIFDEPIGTAFSIFAREDNILYRGNKSPGASGQTAATRHEILERSIPYSLQIPM